MTQAEFEEIRDDFTKEIAGDICWQDDEDHSPSVEFRAEVSSSKGYPLFVNGSYSSKARKLSFAVIHAKKRRIFGFCIGSDHHNPRCDMAGDPHKHSWDETTGTKFAEPLDPNLPPVDQVAAIWLLFCNEFNLTHSGTMQPVPLAQEDLWI